MVQKGFIKKFKKIVELNVQWTFSERFDQNPEIKCSEPTFSERSENVGIWTLKCNVQRQRSVNVQWTSPLNMKMLRCYWTFTERSVNVRFWTLNIRRNLNVHWTFTERCAVIREWMKVKSINNFHRFDSIPIPPKWFVYVFVPTK